MKTNDILLFGGLAVGAVLLMRKNGATLQSQEQARMEARARQVGSDLGATLSKIFSGGKPATTPVQGPVGAGVPDYINASTNALNALVGAYQTVTAPKPVTGPNNQTYVPAKGNAGPYYRALAQNGSGRATSNDYFNRLSFYDS
jgi:hypothetical protein